MRIPLILLPLTLIAAICVWLWSAYGFWVAYAATFMVGYGLFIACTLVNGRRSDRIRNHPFSLLDDDRFRLLCLLNAETRITFYDSVLAGNCIWGTLAFVRRAFPWRKNITLGELYPYCKCKGNAAWRIKHVALYKLIRLNEAGHSLLRLK